MIDAGIAFDRDSLPPLVQTLDGVFRDAEKPAFLRQEKLHRGLSRLSALTGPSFPGVSPLALASRLKKKARSWC
jgi:hypothetical protein